jgi:hypothetical protein
LETAATGNETVGGGVFFPGRKHPISGAADKRTDREEKRRENTQRKETQKRETEERSMTQIKEDPSSRSKEEPGPLRDATSEGHNTL